MTFTKSNNTHTSEDGRFLLVKDGNSWNAYEVNGRVRGYNFLIGISRTLKGAKWMAEEWGKREHSTTDYDYHSLWF